MINESNKNALAWDPWVGDNYGTLNKINRKILILGESHYGSEKDHWFNRDLTRLTIQEKIGEAPGEKGKIYKKAFHTNIFKTFNDGNPTPETLKAFWHSVAYMNYVQGTVADTSRVAPKKEDWDESQEAVTKKIEELQPDAILVLGYRLWDNIWFRFADKELHVTQFNNHRNTIRLKNGSKPIMFCVKHPSAGYSSNFFREFVLKYIMDDTDR